MCLLWFVSVFFEKSFVKPVGKWWDYLLHCNNFPLANWATYALMPFLRSVFHLSIGHKLSVLRCRNQFPLKCYRLTYWKSCASKLDIFVYFIEWKMPFFFLILLVPCKNICIFSYWCLVFSRWYFTSNDDSVLLVLFLELKRLTLNYTDTVKLQTETNFRSNWLKFRGLALSCVSGLIT